MTSCMKKLVFVGVLASGMALGGCKSRNAANEPGTGGGGKNLQGTFSPSGTTKSGETGSGMYSAPQEPGVRESQGNPTPSHPDTELPERRDSLNANSGTSGMAQQPNTRPGTGSNVSGGQTPTSHGKSEAGVQGPGHGKHKKPANVQP